MLSSTVIKPLSHEGQLGGALNESIRSGETDRFRLLLAMLSDDVCDQVQFERLARPEQDTHSLRAQFELPPEQELYTQASDLNKKQAATQLHQGGLLTLHLQHCLHPEPLAGLKMKLAKEDVLQAFSPWQRYKQEVEDVEQLKPGLNWQLADQALLNLLRMQTQTSALVA